MRFRECQGSGLCVPDRAGKTMADFADATEFLTVAQAAALLGISERTMRRRCENGQYEAERVTTDTGKTWRIPRAQIEPLAEAAATSEAKAGESSGQAVTATAASSGQAAATETGGAVTDPEGAASSGQEMAARAATMTEGAARPAATSGESSGQAAASSGQEVRPESTPDINAALLIERDRLIEQLQGERDRLIEELADSKEDAKQWRAMAAQLMRQLPAADQRPAFEAPREMQSTPEAQVTDPPAHPAGRRPRPLWMVILGYRPKWLS